MHKGTEERMMENIVIRQIKPVVDRKIPCQKREENVYQKGRAWIELSKDHFLWNLAQFRQILPSDCKVMAAVKANAYGHGSIQTARILQEALVEDYCVAALSEGIELRRAGIKGQILILGYTHPQLLKEAIRYDLTQTIVDSSYARELELLGLPLKVNVGIDTGMHRIGEHFENIHDILKIWEIPNLKITGIFSHLCVADGNSPEEREYTMGQIAGFRKVLAKLKQAGITGVKAHLLSTYGVLNYPEECFDYARIGIALYGILSSVEDRTKVCLDLRPVLTLKARVESIRNLKAGESAGYGLAYTAEGPVRIAALAVGYADGVPRGMSNTGWVLINGCKAPVIGRICMDQMLVDVTQVKEVTAGDEAVLIGKSESEEISAPLFASWTGTIANEVLSRLGGRLERVVV